ncbi:MAG: phosphoenolpyruvate carboxylase [Alphaproteobacteria bacterium]|nr:phosphoenolpyruvate carboxylase [Alphaproteobacteria bacterium]
MQHAAQASTSVLVRDLLALTARTRESHDADPFGNPVLSIALVISRRIDAGTLTPDEIEALVRQLRDAAFADRAARLAAYVGDTNPAANRRAMAGIAERIVRPDPSDSPVPLAAFRAAVERTRFAAVFTAHPTFSLPPEVARALAAIASGRPAESGFVSHRPSAPTLIEEFDQAAAAISNGRDALDVLTEVILDAARTAWPNRWTEVVPVPVILSSWVGYDTDGRTDIGWWDTLRIRLLMKRLQLTRFIAQVSAVPDGAAVADRAATAVAAVDTQIAAAPTSSDADQVAAFAHALISRREEALISTVPLEDMLSEALAVAPEAHRMPLAIARAGLRSHGLALAHTHVRLNASQIHNAARMRLGLADAPEDPSHRRALLSAINTALDDVQTLPVDFGALLAEGASATRLLMTVAQLLKHVDTATPVRFLIAETESGYTLLAALWLARTFGIAEKIEISPLFETAEALETGLPILEDALRSPHWREYLRATGRFALQFGYSDSGRYIGPLAASYLIERVRLKLTEALMRHKLTSIEVVFFDTHGESVGRGAHPRSLSERLRYLSPPVAKQALTSMGILSREESAFQGGDGYLLFGTPELATATITQIAEHVFTAKADSSDPIYAETDFSADFFATCRSGMQELVNDAGYAALLGVFGPALLDRTGSRPAARQQDGIGGPALIRHPRELRAIPNNSILHQLGWMANSLQGLGAAAARHPEAFAELRASSWRFRNALALAEHALAHSDIDVLRAVVATLDPGMWLDRAAHARIPGRRHALVAVARALERLDLWADAQAMFRRIQADQVSLRAVYPDAPRPADREILLHAVRLALIHRVWLLASGIPDFAPRHGVTRAALEQRLLRLDVPAAVKFLAEVFPAAPDPAAERDYAEPRAPRASTAYAREHAEIFAPMLRLFDLIREIGTAVTHEVGALG